MSTEKAEQAQTWRTAHGGMTDAERELIETELVASYWNPGLIGRPVPTGRRHLLRGCHGLSVAAPAGVLPELEHRSPHERG